MAYFDKNAPNQVIVDASPVGLGAVLTLPDGPWQDLAVDLLGPLPSKHSILVVVDYYSRFYEYPHRGSMTSTTTSNVIDSLEGIFSRHGLPITLKSDNGPQFRSDEFKDFCEGN